MLPTGEPLEQLSYCSCTPAPGQLEGSINCAKRAIWEVRDKKKLCVYGARWAKNCLPDGRRTVCPMGEIQCARWAIHSEVPAL